MRCCFELIWRVLWRVVRCVLALVLACGEVRFWICFCVLRFVFGLHFDLLQVVVLA